LTTGINAREPLIFFGRKIRVHDQVRVSLVWKTQDFPSPSVRGERHASQRCCWGAQFYWGGIGGLFNFWRRGHSLLGIQQQALKQDNQLRVNGLIPRYARQEKRSNFSAYLILYKVDAIEGEDDILRVTELLHEKMSDRDLRFRVSDEGTRFEVEYSLPPVRKSQKQAAERHVRHLQVSMDEAVEQKNDKPKRYSWTVAFPLPLSSR